MIIKYETLTLLKGVRAFVATDIKLLNVFSKPTREILRVFMKNKRGNKGYNRWNLQLK